MADPQTYSTASRKKSVAQEPVTSVLRGDELPIYTRELTADEEILAALGYKPEFKREFSLWTSFCVSFAVLGLLPSFASTLYYVSRGPIARTEKPRSHKRITGHGIRRHSRHDMGVVDCHVLHPVRRYEYGGIMLVNAHERRTLLRRCCVGASVRYMLKIAKTEC